MYRTDSECFQGFAVTFRAVSFMDLKSISRESLPVLTHEMISGDFCHDGCCGDLFHFRVSPDDRDGRDLIMKGILVISIDLYLEHFFRDFERAEDFMECLLHGEPIGFLDTDLIDSITSYDTHASHDDAFCL